MTAQVVSAQPILYDPNQYTFFGFMGLTVAVVLCNLGSSYGCAKAGMGVSAVGVVRSDLVYKSLLPVIMAGILGIYGLIIGIILIGKISCTPQQDVANFYSQTQNYSCTGLQYSAYNGFRHLAAGLCCGFSSLAAGLTLGIAGDAGVRANAQKDIYVGVILMLIFGEALGLYGLIIAIILTSKAPVC